MIITAIFKIAKIWKQLKHSSTEERIKKMWCICIYIYTRNRILLSHKNEITPFAGTWMDLEVIIVSEISQMEKDK